MLAINWAHMKRTHGDEWHGACPLCGGSDRFVLWRTRGNYWCRVCNAKGFLDGDTRKPSVDEYAALEQRIKAAEQQRENYRRQRLAEFTTDELWQEYHERMQADNIAWWESKGIPIGWHNYYDLGYTPSKTFQHDGAKFQSPAYTIPIFDVGRIPVNMQYRLVDPPPGVGKYRQEHGIPAAAFLSDPDAPIPDEVMIVEGAIKAAVTFICMDAKTLTIGIPGARSWAGIPERVKACGRVWVVLDPDAQQAARDLAKAVGKAARIVSLPCKPDDMLTCYGATVDDLRRAMKEARA